MSVTYAVTLYNKCRYIEAVLRSVVAEQHETGGEILIYDDASTDGSRAIVEQFAREAPVTLIVAPENGGLLRATEALIRRAGQPYLRLVDGDDRLVAGSTARLRDGLDRLGADLVHGWTSSDPEHAKDWDFRPVRHAFRQLLRNIDFNVSGALLRTEAVRRALPLRPELRTAQDLLIALRLARTGIIGMAPCVAALSPRESENRLWRRLALSYRTFCLIIAPELRYRSDGAYALRRNARRCSRYFKREAPRGLSLSERAALALMALTPPWRPLARSQRQLLWIASLYERDEARVLA